MGIDIHELVSGRNLILGGVKIPFEVGLKGHSDADALLHAIIDSFCGAILHRDIGNLFPDNNEEYKGISSVLLLERSYGMIKNKGWRIQSLDCVIVAQQPKMQPYIPQMRSIIGGILEIDIDDISIKATTTEHLGFVGRKEGIACFASCLLVLEETMNEKKL